MFSCGFSDLGECGFPEHCIHCTFRSVLCFFFLKELSLCEFHCSVHEIGWHYFIFFGWCLLFL